MMETNKKNTEQFCEVPEGMLLLKKRGRMCVLRRTGTLPPSLSRFVVGLMIVNHQPPRLLEGFGKYSKAVRWMKAQAESKPEALACI